MTTDQNNEQLVLFSEDECRFPGWVPPLESPAATPKPRYAYRVTQDWPNDHYKDYMFRRNKRTVPMATKQRVSSILAAQRRTPAVDRAVTTIERIEVAGEWEDCTSQFDVPQPSEG